MPGELMALKEQFALLEVKNDTMVREKRTLAQVSLLPLVAVMWAFRFTYLIFRRISSRQQRLGTA
jgi:hypothetical protein